MPNALIVDDHEENAYLLQALLSANGYRVQTASNGAEALSLARREPPDVIISDVLMPVMDGFSLCRECKRDGALAAIPFVFYTATYTDPKDEQLALSLGADLFLVKPAEPEALGEAVQRLLQCRQPRAAAAVAPAAGEEAYLRQYNETLVRKLEHKLVELEHANRALALRSAVIDSSVSGVALAGHDGRLTYVNRSYARICGVAAAALLGTPLLERFEDEAARAAIETALASQGSWVGEVRMRRADGVAVVLQGLFERVRDGAGKPLCLMLSCVDVTERSRMREELQRTQRLESLSIFSRSIAHDFNNLLMGVLGNLELGIKALPSGSPALPYLEVAIGVYERARSLTQRLQAFAKPGPAERRRIDVQDLLRESGSLSLSGSNVRLSLAPAAELPAVEADPNQLSQVFNNLLINARQAMPSGGTVFVSAARRTLSAAEAGALRPGEYVVVSVRDEGPGIPSDVAPRIFDPFFTTKPAGSGLGLATSYWIVQDHGGEIRLAADAGAGATFLVLLPAVGVASRRALPAAAAELRGAGRVLVMDDEVVVRETARRMLTLAGYEVTTAEDGEAAAEAITRASDHGQPIDLALLDLTVRGGTGGLETLARLRAVRPELVVVLSSGYRDEASIRRASDLGCVAFIQKPYLQHELLSLVKAAIARTQQPA
jgi:two-component system cell cycle sensor histidine kinase/response regulator CckA